MGAFDKYKVAAKVPTFFSQAFTSSGTFTPSKGLIDMRGLCYVFLRGAGGGGGRGGTNNGGGSGGGGGYAVHHLVVTTPQTVTIGAGGVGQKYYWSNAGGGAGGTTSFGSLLSVPGGGGGVNLYNDLYVFGSVYSAGASGLGGSGSSVPNETIGIGAYSVNKSTSGDNVQYNGEDGGGSGGYSGSGGAGGIFSGGSSNGGNGVLGGGGGGGSYAAAGADCGLGGNGDAGYCYVGWWELI